MIDAENVTISDSEWEIMRVIWTLHQVTSRQLIDTMHETQGWSDSTTKTLLSRLIKKAAVRQIGEHRPFSFEPIVTEQESMATAAIDLFDRMCAMRAGKTLEQVINSRELSQSDIKQLLQVLTAKQETAPEMVECNCLPDGDHDCCEVDSNEK
ncbi:CopY/TcrY family copper transport repressor [Lentilactobacillus kosonis]|uniref:Negative transcriptional regulator-copper transport operon n=1 Tax=Lentilactobacillus kosonis TaxID=2810561 RepID=A0A401FM81_9LACO|nr:CopY/TcrY family copper transport repressor [Lentilactobacillus kosonis]GAY73426.1 negative transcriptional regulator-copper transport operon [Lentilactobacillus kosonis]